MKMKDVCAKTGLTERAVRFYAEKELIHPKKTKVNGRENWEFDEKDVEELLFIAKLREAEFTIQDIKDMQENGSNISDIITNHCVMLRERRESDTKLLRELMNLQNSSNQNWKTIGNSLFQSKNIEESRGVQYDEPIDASLFKKIIEKMKENWEASTETQNVLKVIISIVLLVGTIGRSLLDYVSGNRFLIICSCIIILLRLIIKLVGNDRG